MVDALTVLKLGADPPSIKGYRPPLFPRNQQLPLSRCNDVPQWEANQSEGLDWMMPTGLTRAHVSDFPVPQAAVPHLVGKEGRTVHGGPYGGGPFGCHYRHYWCRYWPRDSSDIVGPWKNAEIVHVFLGMLSKGVRSVLSQISGAG